MLVGNTATHLLLTLTEFRIPAHMAPVPRRVLSPLAVVHAILQAHGGSARYNRSQQAFVLSIPVG